MIRMRVVVLVVMGMLIPPPPRSVAQASPPRLVAHWERSGVRGSCSVSLAGLTCLSRNQWLIRCWPNLPAEQYIMLLGSVGPLDANHHPAAGDTFVLQQDGATFRAKLEGVVFLPLFRR